MQDKNDALSSADLVVLFVGEAYYNSHEMHTEYTSIIRQRGRNLMGIKSLSVSYTHLTLPTS